MVRINPKGRQKEVFRAEVSDVRQIATILKTVNIAAETKVTVGIAKDGLTFTTLVGSTISVRALLDGTTNFTKYEFHPPARGEAATTKKQKQKQKRGASSRHNERDSSATQASDHERDTTRDGHDDDENEQDEGQDEGGGDEEDEDVKVEFEISLTSLLNCINIFGESTVKPTSAKQVAAREKWKAKQNGYGNRREGTHADEDANAEEDELAGGEDDNDNDNGRWGGQQNRGASTVNLGKKKGVTTMQMSYKADGSPLVLLLEENGIVTRCDITTFDSVEVSDLPYDDEARVQKLILNSSWLADALSEIDPSCKSLTLRFAPPRDSDRRIAQQSKGKNRAGQRGSDDDDNDDEDGDGRNRQRTQAAFSLEGTSNHGSVQMDYPYTKEIVEQCDCKEAIRNSYRFSHLMYIRQALAHSTKTSLRTDENGILSMQFMIASAQAASEGSAFVEFTCMPQNDEDEEDDGV